MARFVDRKLELTAVRERLAGPASLTLVYGQRRTGKTFLLQHLLADDPDAVYFLADESTSASLLRRFHASVQSRGRGGPLWNAVTLADWSTALGLLAQAAAAEGRRLVLVLDELQYLLAAEPALPSILQRLWDELRHRLPLHVILCGSALGTLGRLGEAGQPLHGRFDLRLKLRPFGYRQAAEFVPGWSRTDHLRLYGVFGGLARHLAELRPDEDLTANAIRAILDPLAPLHEAPLDILRTEHLSAHAEANAVLAAVAAGENRFNAIAARAGLTSARLDYVLKELLELEVLRREVRFGDRPGSKYVRYRCTDPFTTFWFRHIRPNRGALIGTPPGRLWAERIAPQLDGHLGPVFETVVQRALEDGLLLDRFGPLDEVSAYWSRDGQTEIDAVARFGQRLLLVECKWRPDGEVDLPELQRLREHAATLSDPRPRQLALATAGRFSSRLREAAAADDIDLIGPDALLPAGGA